jgi:hypothetical protein
MTTYLDSVDKLYLIVEGGKVSMTTLPHDHFAPGFPWRVVSDLCELNAVILLLSKLALFESVSLIDDDSPNILSQ